MIFFMVCFIILGLIGGTAFTVSDIRFNSEDALIPLPQWMRTEGGRLQWTYILAGGGPLIATLSTLVDYGSWVVASIMELYIGFLCAKKLIPLKFQVIIFSISPIPVIVITGSFLNYWYID
jgi:hypothetical protein